MDIKNQTLAYGDTDEDFPPFLFKNVITVLILATIAVLIVWKWPPAAFMIALIPVAGGPVGILLYYGLFFMVRQLIIKLFQLNKSY